MGVIKRYMAFVTPYKKQIALTMVIGDDQVLDSLNIASAFKVCH